MLLKIVCHCSTAVETVLKSLDDPRTAGLILEEQANALKSILGDASVLKLVRVRPLFIYLLVYLLWATRGARDPNLWVAIRHIWHNLCSQLHLDFISTKLRMNEMHQMQSDQVCLDLLSDNLITHVCETHTKHSIVAKVFWPSIVLLPALCNLRLLLVYLFIFVRH